MSKRQPVPTFKRGLRNWLITQVDCRSFYGAASEYK
jgi:hypothetical protein